MKKTIMRYNPDLFGLKETKEAHLETYLEFLTGYEHHLGPPAEEPPHCYNAIFWNPTRLNLVDSGGFWLSETPEKHSASWGTSCIRAANWVKLSFTDSHKEFLYLNTHLDHVSERARIEGGKLIIHRLFQMRSGNIPLIVNGDFNNTPGLSVHNIFADSGFVDTYLKAGNEDSESVNTYHAFEGDSYSPSHYGFTSSRIDWILTLDGKLKIVTKSCKIIKDNEHPLYPSDHYPVISDLQFIPTNH